MSCDRLSRGFSHPDRLEHARDLDDGANARGVSVLKQFGDVLPGVVEDCLGPNRLLAMGQLRRAVAVAVAVKAATT